MIQQLTLDKNILFETKEHVDIKYKNGLLRLKIIGYNYISNLIAE